MKKIIFAGNGRLACNLLTWLRQKDEIIILLRHPDDDKKYVKEGNLERLVGKSTLIFKDDAFNSKTNIKRIENLEPDLLISIGYGFIFSEEFLKIPRYGGYNVHFSLLPLHRGRHPTHWALVEGTDAGVTIHRLAKKIDSGNIIAQERIQVKSGDTAEKLYEREEKAAEKLFKDNWRKIRAGFLGIKQKGKGCYHSHEDFLKIMIRSK